MVDSPTVSEMIHMVSCDEFILPMATVDNIVVGKKGTVFVGDLVISTGNSIRFSHNLMTNLSAVYRRRTLNVKVTVDSDCYDDAAGRIDMVKVKEKYKKGGIS